MDTIALQLVEWLPASLPMLLLLAGAGLMVAEAIAPGAHFIVVGVALLVTGLVGLVLMSVLSVAPLVTLFAMAITMFLVGSMTLYVYREFDFYGGKGSGKTSDSDALRGQTGRVTEPVTRSSGQVKLDNGGFNPFYQARSLDADIPAGEEVIVVEPGGGNVITVESMSAIENDIDRELARNTDEEPESETA